MRVVKLQKAALALSLLAAAGAIAVFPMLTANAQTNTSGAIAGVVSDPSGAAVTNATVNVKSLATGAIRTSTTNTSGEFQVSQLPPGRYEVSMFASGFETTKRTIDVGVGTVTAVNVALTVGQTNVTVEVLGSELPLLHIDDAQLSTTFSSEDIQELPNPGNDLTFVAQTAPGTIMNTQSGYGNFSSFGLPGTANTYTVNGGYYNDPFLNLNNSGATNLTLGANDIDTVTVTSNAYNASFGGLGGAQVSEISKSGSNKFHGSAKYWWNGRLMNANDYFNNNQGTKRPFVNVNQWAASLGGPIIRDRTFFFGNYEGLRVVLPTRATVYAPSPSYQSNVLANLTANGLSDEIPVYQNIFKLYSSSPGYSSAAVSTSDTAAGGYGTVKFNATAGNFTHEYLFNGRVDHTFTDKDHLFAHWTIDKGLQATYTNLLNPIFNADSPQPAYEGQIGEQHIFSPHIANSFMFSTIYYRAVFTNTSEAASAKLVPFTLVFADGDLGSNGIGAWPGGLNLIWPQGRNVTGYQFQEDLNWINGKHTLGIGWTMRRDDITDFSPSEYTISPEAVATSASFQQGYVDLWYEQFPTRNTQPVALYAMGWYLQDQYKALPNLTITYGLRFEHNSDPICHTNCFSRLPNNFASVSASPSTPYNAIISTHQQQAMKNLQFLGYEPRIGFAFLPFGAYSRTTLRGGFGMFADAFPGQIADSFLNNVPTSVPMTIYGPAFGGSNTALVPLDPASAASVASGSAKAFQSGFANGASFNTLSALNGFSAPSISTAQQTISYPTYEEWSFAIEQQFSKANTVSVMYVGNRTYHQPVLNNSVNAWNSGGASGFSTLSTKSAPNPNFAAVTEVGSSAISNFNGVVVFWKHKSKTLEVNLNYQWSHALDEISNGGFNGFSGNSVSPDNPFNLRDNYGNADYDVRHYVSGNYVYKVPHFWGPRVLTANWEFTGDVFHSTGLPFSVTDSSISSNFANYGGPLYAKQTASFGGHTHCGGTKATATATGNNVPCAFASDFADPTGFGQSRRNQLFGPNYTDTDFAAIKGFSMPGWESAKLKVGAQFFNLFNHPNFGQPGGNFSSSATFGLITGTVNTPTSILGSFLGGDASPRLVQLTAKFEF